MKGLAGASGITAGDNHSCAWLSPRTAKCWGSNTYGQLGSGTTTSTRTPVTVIRL